MRRQNITVPSLCVCQSVKCLTSLLHKWKKSCTSLAGCQCRVKLGIELAPNRQVAGFKSHFQPLWRNVLSMLATKPGAGF